MLKNLLCKAEDIVNYIKSNLTEFMKYKEIIIFGAGIGGSRILQLLEESGGENKIVCFSDNSSMKVGRKYGTKQVIHPEKLFYLHPDALVIVASTAFDKIKAQLLDYGFKENRIRYFQIARMDNDGEYIWEHIELYEKAYRLLADEKSKRIFLNLLNYRVTRNILYLENMANDLDAEEEQYFDHELVKTMGRKYFIDCGSYTGDTIETLIKKFGKDMNCIGLEADPLIFKMLTQKCAEAGWNHVEVQNVAVWKEFANLRMDVSSFENGGSAVCKDGSIDVRAESIDSIVGEREAGYIKMDIEGAELYALEGARKVISRDTPLLGICVYHKIEDFYSIPLFVNEINNKYKLYFRQYRYGQSETVCYAVAE